MKMSIEMYYLSYLRMLALQHNWSSVGESSAELEQALLQGSSSQVVNAMERLNSSLFVDAPSGPPQALRQAREHFNVLNRMGVARFAGEPV